MRETPEKRIFLSEGPGISEDEKIRRTKPLPERLKSISSGRTVFKHPDLQNKGLLPPSQYL